MLDSPKPIEDNDMVAMLVEHMEMGDLAAKAYKFKNIQDPNEKTWPKAKAYFRAALRKMKRIKEGQTNNEDLQVNAATINKEANQGGANQQSRPAGQRCGTSLGQIAGRRAQRNTAGIGEVV